MPSGLRLLDLGAAGGHLGRAVRDRCSFIAGVEPHPPQSASAKEGYDDWREQDALHAGQWDEPFDAVVCADVLEHFAQPEELLERVRGWLKDGGVLFASIPNVANISVRLALLFGQFRYADRGILDRTHLTFYTRASAKDLLEKERLPDPRRGGDGDALRAGRPSASGHSVERPDEGLRADDRQDLAHVVRLPVRFRSREE